MNADGLLVDSIDTSGGIVRVPKATAISRDDKTSTGENLVGISFIKIMNIGFLYMVIGEQINNGSFTAIL